MDFTLSKDIGYAIGSLAGIVYGFREIRKWRKETTTAQENAVKIPLLVNGDRKEFREAFRLLTEMDEDQDRRLASHLSKIRALQEKLDEEQHHRKLLTNRVYRLENPLKHDAAEA